MKPTTAPRSLAAVLLLAATAFATLLLAAPPAAAHATLTGSTPRDGEVVAAAPERVSLTFSEHVAVADDAIRVLDPTGEPAHTGTPTDLSTDDSVRHAIALRDGLPRGTYTVAWHVVSADSHPISGAFTFSIGAPSATSVDLPGTGDGTDAVGLIYDTTRYAAYAGFLLLAGGGAFVLRCWPAAAACRPAQRTLLTGWVTLTIATLAQLLLRTPYTGSGRLADAFDLGGLRDVIETKTGTALLTRLLLLAAAAAFIAVLTGPHARLRTAPPGAVDPGRLRHLGFGLATGGLIVATGIAATWSMAEHASTGPQTGLSIPSHTLHLLAIAAWLGGLVTLLVLLHREPTALPGAAVRRYSQLAFSSVVALAATGLYQSWRQVRTLSALTGTEYGRLLIAKVTLVAGVLAVAWFSRRITARLAAPPPAPRSREPEPGPGPETESDVNADPERARQLARQRTAVQLARRRKDRDADPGRSRLRRTVLVEAAVAAVILAVTTALTSTSPARTEAASQAGTPSQDGGQDATEPASPGGPYSGSLPYDTGGEFGQGTAQLELTPARTGGNTLHIRLLDPKGLPNGAIEIRVALTLTAEDIGPLRHEPDHVDVGHWTVPSVQLPHPGDWQLDLTIRTSDIDQITVSTTIPIT